MTNKPFSPVCYASECSDAYMGYADRDEILAALNALLEAERAGTRVASSSRRETTLTDYSALMHDVGQDEAHWCAMLTRQIRRLDGCPSRKTGAFFEKAMAISDPLERLVFLNRGQAWVVRKLEKLFPRISDDALHADLKAMAKEHRANINLIEIYLQSKGKNGPEND